MSLVNTYYPVFPSARSLIPGLTISVTKRPEFKTRRQTSVSGRELTVVDQPNPVWHFKLEAAYLRDGFDTRATGLGRGIANGLKTELRRLGGFFMGMQGAAGLFYYDDPTDDTVLAATALPTAPATAATFQLQRSWGTGVTFAEPITDPNTVTEVYYNGTPQGIGNFALGAIANPGLIRDTRGNVPGATTVTADFSYYFRCRFEEDGIDLENFLYQIWSVREIKFKSILL